LSEYDYIVIGGGSGGLASAQRAAEYGARVLVFEDARLGGTCVNVGCVPKKVMWTAAQLAHALEESRDYGFDVAVNGHDWPRLRAARDAYVEFLNGIYARNLDRRGVELVAARAELESDGVVKDSNGQRYGAKHVLIATGGCPRIPELPGAALGITSDGFFELDRLPGSVAVVGSGYIAVELAGVLRSLGARVTQVIRYGAMLRSFDSMLSDKLMDAQRALGVDVVTDAILTGVEAVEGQRYLLLEDGRRLGGFDTLIWAIGRDPSTQDLGLDRLGIATDAEGYIVVDKYQTTSVPNVYAVGDVTGRAQLTPVAIAAGRRLSDRVFGGRPERHLSYDVIPTVIFSHPPIGTVGMSEQEARERFPNEPLKIYTSEFVPMYYALSDQRPRTAMKLVTLGNDERIVGCHIIGLDADEMLQGFAVAVSMGARKTDLDDTIAIHPTSAEELVTMR
jgi:glutathione reductase (NADPH)